MLSFHLCSLYAKRAVGVAKDTTEVSCIAICNNCIPQTVKQKGLLLCVAEGDPGNEATI